MMCLVQGSGSPRANPTGSKPFLQLFGCWARLPTTQKRPETMVRVSRWNWPAHAGSFVSLFGAAAKSRCPRRSSPPIAGFRPQLSNRCRSSIPSSPSPLMHVPGPRLPRSSPWNWTALPARSMVPRTAAASAVLRG